MYAAVRGSRSNCVTVLKNSCTLDLGGKQYKVGLNAHVLSLMLMFYPLISTCVLDALMYLYVYYNKRTLPLCSL